MARKATFSNEEIVQANELRNSAKTVEEMHPALSVLLMVDGGIEAEKASSLLGICTRTLFRYRESFRSALPILLGRTSALSHEPGRRTGLSGSLASTGQRGRGAHGSSASCRPRGDAGTKDSSLDHVPASLPAWMAEGQSGHQASQESTGGPGGV